MRDGPLEAGVAMKHVQELVKAGGSTYIKLGQFIATAQGLLPDEWVEAFVDSVAGQFADNPDVPALVLEVELPDGRQRSWELNTGGAGNPATVSGTAADMIGWLTGRQDGSRLGGNVPRLPAWL